MGALLNRARMTTATTGTGTITLGSASNGFASFAEAGATNATAYSYCIEDGNDFEIGVGTYTSSGTTFSRDTVTLSKIGGTAGTTKLTLSGSATIFITARAQEIATLDAAQTYTATQTITPAANTSALVSSGGSLTGANAQSLIDLAQTWNTSGTPTLIKANVTDTASNAASSFLEFQISGTTRHKIDKTAIFFWSKVESIGGQNGFYSTGLYCNANSTIGFGAFNSSGAGNAPDAYLSRDAANTLAQRNGTNAQTFRVYNTFTDASNYERLATYVSSNVFYVESQAAGTGTFRNLRLSCGNTPGGNGGYLEIRSDGTFVFARSGTATWWQISNTGMFQPTADNTYDIGLSSQRVRNYFQAGYSELAEMTAPAAGAVNTARVFARDNGSGKTQLCVIFNTGAIQVLATEP